LILRNLSRILIRNRVDDVPDAGMEILRGTPVRRGRII